MTLRRWWFFIRFSPACRSTWVCICIALAIGLIAYLLVPLVGKIPLRTLIAIIMAVIGFVVLRRPLNIQTAPLTSMIALLVSCAALTHSISQYEETKKLGRPYFQIVSSEVQKMEGEERYLMSFKLQNTPGQRSAHAPSLCAIMINLETGQTIDVSGTVSTLNDVPGAETLTWKAPLSLEAWVGSYVRLKKPPTIIFGIINVYSDPVLNRYFWERHVMKWENKNGVYDNGFNFETGDIPQGILEKIDRFGGQSYARVLESVSNK